MVAITTVQENHVGSILGQSPWMEEEGTEAGEIWGAERMKHDCLCFHLLREREALRAECSPYSF